MTLISQGSSSGEERRCDAKCYAATSPVCTCVCGGLNHGVGLVQAVDNTTELARGVLKVAGKEDLLFPLLETNERLKLEVLGQTNMFNQH